MTPSRLRDELASVQQRLRQIEEQVELQKAANPLYHEVLHEMVESQEALDRALGTVDKIGFRSHL